MKFQELNLHEEILKSIEDAGFESPTPIQAQAIPEILKGIDLRMSAQTGTGKTATFILPALHKLLTTTPVRGHGPRILILVPTRELAVQVAEEAKKFSERLSKVKTVCIYGGSPYPAQIKQLSRPYEILVATPGRLIDHLERERIHLGRVEMLILDEADRMLDMGFIGPVEEISALVPESRQTLLFSATLKGNVMKLSQRIMKKDVKEVSVASEQMSHAKIEQRLYYIDDLNHKFKILEHLLNDETIKQAIIFTGTKRFADELVDKLYHEGHETAALHGDMNQRQRNRTIMRLRNEEIRFLVATDVAARGIDVQTVTHVINFDFPNNKEDYIHRIGRTGRAGASGIAISLASSTKDRMMLEAVQHYMGVKIEAHVIPGLEPKPSRDKGGSSKRSFSRGKSYGGGGQQFKPRRSFAKR